MEDLHSDFITITSAKTSSDLEAYVTNLIEHPSEWTRTTFCYSVTVSLLWSPHLSKDQVIRLSAIESLRHILAKNSQLPLLLLEQGDSDQNVISDLLKLHSGKEAGLVRGACVGYILSHSTELNASQYTAQELHLAICALASGVEFPAQPQMVRSNFLKLLATHEVALEPWVQEQVDDNIKKYVAETYVKVARSPDGVPRSYVREAKVFLNDFEFVKHLYQAIRDLPPKELCRVLTPLLDYKIANLLELQKLILFVAIHEGYVQERPLKKSVEKVISTLGLGDFFRLSLQPIPPESEEQFVKNLAKLREIILQRKERP